MHRRSEIAILEELTRATCRSADRCAVASRAGGESSHRRIVIETPHRYRDRERVAIPPRPI